MERFDIIIVGGGMAGASLGAEVVRDRRVALIEAESLPGVHSTGRSAAFWLESYGGAEVARLSAASHRFLATPPADFADVGFLRPRGAIHVDSTGRPDAFAGIPPSVKTSPMTRTDLEAAIPGIDPRWVQGRMEAGCADIDVAGLHTAYLGKFRRGGGRLMTDSRLESGRFEQSEWRVRLGNGAELAAPILVDAAGAWADPVARACGVGAIDIAPKRRTMVQLRVGQSGIARLPQVIDAAGSFYFKGEGDRSVWVSPHDEIATGPCDAAPEEIDIAVAIDRFQGAVDWPVERVERSWAGLRSFAPDRLPVYGYDFGSRRIFLVRRPGRLRHPDCAGGRPSGGIHPDRERS